MAIRWPNAAIHAFEPVPEILLRLKTNTAKHCHISYHPYALSDSNKPALFYVSEKPTRPGIASQAGSLHQPKERLKVSPLIFPRTLMVNTISLPEWAERNNINHIDLLWLDTQGHELTILQAATSFLKNIRVVLAEVSFIESYEKQPLYADVVDWMAQQGFELVGCDFENQTKTFFGNALFVNKAYSSQ
jgi:FkbM family methyltransferase